ncbi:CASP-like protein 4U1 [Panicum miliaceum]|uniref:CASP-like protein n=1 Tax=Panicum miliaceum TaxID=4540 RepID=A0A3L6PLP4_PANMI|nr:CASP-like protein 4U1 [Panicum miliaceum]
MCYGRYAVGVNVVVCVCSISQAIAEVRRLRPQRSSTPRSTSIYCINLFLDQASSAHFLPVALTDRVQVLAYLLMSAASAAASRNNLWAARFGEDQFSRKVSVAVWLSFLGFLALSANALISMANLFRRIDMPN